MQKTIWDSFEENITRQQSSAFIFPRRYSSSSEIAVWCMNLFPLAKTFPTRHVLPPRPPESWPARNGFLSPTASPTPTRIIKPRSDHLREALCHYHCSLSGDPRYKIQHSASPYWAFVTLGSLVLS